MKTDLSVYTAGYAIGIIVMILVNVILDIVLVAILDMGVWGLALATSASNWAYFLILVSYYVLGKAQLKYRIGSASWKELPTLVKIGFPAALLVFALAVRKPGPFPAGTRSACRILPPSSVWPMRLTLAAARNAKLLYDIESIADEIEKYYHRLVRDCKRLDITDTTFCMVVHTDEPEIKGAMEMLRDKIQDTLDLCRSVVNHRTPFTISQRNVEIEWI